MLTPEPMRHLALAVLRRDLEAATRAIANTGVLHLLDVRHLGDTPEVIHPYDVSEQQARLQRLAATLDDILAKLGIAGPFDGDLELPSERLDVAATEARIEAVTTGAEGLRTRLHQVRDESCRLETRLRTLRALVPLGLPLEALRQLRYVRLVVGLLPARNLQRLRESLARITAVIFEAGEADGAGRVLITALCLRADEEVLQRALRAAQFEPLDLPADLSGTPTSAAAEVETRLAERQAEAESIERESRAFAEERGPEMRALSAALAQERLIVEARLLMGQSERTALISGWVPAQVASRLEQEIRRATGDRCVLQWRDPEEFAGAGRDRVRVPILLRNPVLIRPFERLLRAYGLPRYGEVEPTAVVALGFLTMFGFMFGDVGQGAVLFALGYFIYRRMFRYRDYAVILMECGVFAAFFGLLYGSVFGVESWLPALWLRPMEDMARLMRTAIAFGIGFLSLGLVLNLCNVVRRRDLAALWERNGLLAALAYWIAAAILMRRLTNGPEAVDLGWAALWLAIPIGLILLKEPARMLLRGVRQGRWPSPSEALALIVESCVEVLDTVISMVSNTVTFIRLAAFALSHAGLFLATFSIADAVAKAGGGTLGAMAVIVIGNVVIIGLEGLIVSIQTVRLEYYEFFSKFYSGGGEEYRPLRLGSARSSA